MGMLTSEKINALARICTPADVDVLIGELDALDDSDTEGESDDVRDDVWRLRETLAQILSEIGLPAIDALLRALESTNPDTRAYAAKALGRIGDKRAVDPMLNRLSREEYFFARAFLIEAIGIISSLPLPTPP